ncbi:MAG: hypothetical protein JWN64_811 [Parcubacteria group bacterium]|nr:hypothetical protein [Parcubacteria group bacterium]
MMTSHTIPSRGFTLLIAVVMTSVLLSVALALIDVSYKQVLLASTARLSGIAIYAADSGVECALYYDRLATFAYGTAPSSQSITCNGTSVPVTTTTYSSSIQKTTFTMPCVAGAQSDITMYKTNGVATCNFSAGSSAPVSSTCIYTTGYSSCNSADLRRVERAYKVTY